MDTLTESPCWFVPLLLDELADHIRTTHEGRNMNETERSILEGIRRQIDTILATETAVLTTAAWTCPVHHTNRIVPAGISKKTNQPYNAFVVCGDQGCDIKPPRANGVPTQGLSVQAMP